ncbi:PepSY domain-containing protein [Methylophaga sp.]|uniref:PepSY domain-containing protein n=1 Tax=Methylophaga sp. TaxID=2024840 RepID=UPI002717125B|nr:PepSY domain-containing protein [Methylophaga sp.]MDO8827532.1 PepSY domain-containing protein [Methylophaga sp.]
MRQLFLWHRWLGIGLCLFMSLWFISGMVMLFVGYPKLTHAEHLQSLPVLAVEADYIDVNQAIITSGQAKPPTEVKLSSIAGKPHYLLRFPEQAVIAIDAITGQKIDTTNQDQALASAQAFYPAAKPEYIGRIEHDSWTLSRDLDPERPLHKIRLSDDAGRILYISSHSGRVIRDATFQERSWGWLGAWLHWLYPFRNLSWWSKLIIYLSLGATAMAVLGQFIGIKRWRFNRTYRSGSHSPYSHGNMRWHHLGGMLFGFLLIAWIFSGLMSMNPWNLLANKSEIDIQSFKGEALNNFNTNTTTAELIQNFQQAGIQPRELVWNKVAGKDWVTAYDEHGQSRVQALSSTALVLQIVPFMALKHAVQSMSDTQKFQLEWVKDYDFYYFAREQQSMYGARERPLPILRAKFDDHAKTWIHIDPNNGVVIESIDQNRRIARWLFNLLHSWDWQPLLDRPLLRESLIILFSIGGLIICISGTILGWRRIRRKVNSSVKLQKFINNNQVNDI